MAILLIGDSHLARVRRDLVRLGPDVHQRAVGGASTRDLAGQLAELDLSSYGVVVISVGTNDAAPWKCVPLAEAVALLTRVCAMITRAGPRLLWLAPPGVNEGLLLRDHDRTNAVMDDYRRALGDVIERAGGTILDTPEVLHRLGAAAWIDDGVHLSEPGYELLLDALARTTAHLLASSSHTSREAAETNRFLPPRQ